MKLYLAWHPCDTNGHYLYVFTREPHIEGEMFVGLSKIGMLDRWHSEKLFGVKIRLGECVCVEIKDFTASLVECRRIRWDAERLDWVDIPTAKVQFENQDATNGA